jgi:hypothetical protein
MVAANDRQGVREGEGVRIVRKAAAVRSAAGAHQATRDDDARGPGLTGDARVGDRPGEVDGNRREVDPAHRRSHAVDFRLRRVVADLEFVDDGAECAEEAEDRILGFVLEAGNTSADSLRSFLRALVVEEAHVRRPTRVPPIVEAGADRVLLHLFESLQLIKVEVGIERHPGQQDGLRRDETGAERGDGGNCPRPSRRTRSAFHEVHARVDPIAFIAQEEEGFVLHQRTADGGAELMLIQFRPGQGGDHASVEVACEVEVVRSVESLAAVELEDRATELVGAGLRDHVHLPACARAVLRGVVVGLDPKLLNVLEARLQLEWRGDLARHVSGRGIDDRGALDAIEFDDILLIRTATETDIVPRPGAGILRTGSLEHQLRHLAAVDGEPADLALGHIDADAGRTQVHARGHALDRHCLGHTRCLQRQVEVKVLTHDESHPCVFEGREPCESSLDRVRRGTKGGDDVVSGLVRLGLPLFSRSFVPHQNRGARHRGA